MLKFTSQNIVFLSITILSFPFSLKFTPPCLLYNSHPIRSLTHAHTPNTSFSEEGSHQSPSCTLLRKRTNRERRQAGSAYDGLPPNIFKYKEKGKFINTVQRVYAELRPPLITESLHKHHTWSRAQCVLSAATNQERRSRVELEAFSF